MTTKKLTAWLKEVQDLRTAGVQSEVRLFQFLVQGEAGACPWRGQYSSFKDLIVENALCAPRRYTMFREALRKVNGLAADILDNLGVDGIIQAGRLPTTETLNLFITKTTALRVEKKRTLSAQEIREVSLHISPVLRTTRVHEDTAQLKSENAALKLEVARLTKENATLTRRLAVYEAKDKKKAA
jgi:hypothetical protein